MSFLMRICAILIFSAIVSADSYATIVNESFFTPPQRIRSLEKKFSTPPRETEPENRVCPSGRELMNAYTASLHEDEIWSGHIEKNLIPPRHSFRQNCDELPNKTLNRMYGRDKSNEAVFKIQLVTQFFDEELNLCCNYKATLNTVFMNPGARVQFGEECVMVLYSHPLEFGSSI